MVNYVGFRSSSGNSVDAPIRETPAQAAGPAFHVMAESHDTANAVVADRGYRAVKVRDPFGQRMVIPPPRIRDIGSPANPLTSMPDPR